jgi:hypothetical protein
MKYKTLDKLLKAEGYVSMWYMGRSIYKHVPCGPWISYVFSNGETLHYEDALARAPVECKWPIVQWVKQLIKGVRPKQCIAIKVGSIVEGSDAEVGPMSLTLPLDMNDFWLVVAEVNGEASLLWEEANILQ